MLLSQKYGKNLPVNYSPFGAILYGRNWSSEKYRYGFNGMEKDDEVRGEGNSYDFGARMYDSRLGRWLSLDARADELPFESPYISVGDNPIIFIDPDGKIKVVVHEKKLRGTNNIKKVTFQYIDDGQECLTVHYKGENFERSDFKEGSYEYFLMHQKTQAYNERAGEYYDIEVWQMRDGIQNGPEYTKKVEGQDLTNIPIANYPSFVKLEIYFKAPDKTSFDEAGTENFDKAKEDVETIKEMFRNNTSWEDKFGLKISRPNKNGIIVIGNHSPHPTDRAKIQNPELANQRARNVKKALEGVGNAKAYNGGVAEKRMATIIITPAKQATEKYDSINKRNEVK